MIVANAIQNILSKPGPRVQTPPKTLQKHSEYGKKPKYLQKVQDEIQQENQIIADIAREQQETLHANDPKTNLLDENEKQDLLQKLKVKWDEVNKAYQAMTHVVKPDTITKRKQKEHYEETLAQLEKDIKLLSTKYVFVKE